MSNKRRAKRNVIYEDPALTIRRKRLPGGGYEYTVWAIYTEGLTVIGAERIQEYRGPEWLRRVAPHIVMRTRMKKAAMLYVEQERLKFTKLKLEGHPTPYDWPTAAGSIYVGPESLIPSDLITRKAKANLTGKKLVNPRLFKRINLTP